MHARLPIYVLPAAMLGAGCHSGTLTTQPASNDDLARELRRTTKWQETPISIEQQPVSVAEGPSPLVYIFDVGASIRVMDLTANSRLVSADVPARTLVRVDNRNGVTVGPDNLLPGPLPAGHRFGIFVDPTTPNVIRQGVGPPGDVPR